MKRQFAISTNSKESLKKVLETLFSKGFVFNSDRRLKTFDDFVKAFPAGDVNGFIAWNWISIGYDRHCKMVLDASTDMPYQSIDISLDNFV